ncbi:MAG: BTAD domain-containing putative transcriptional regulator [Nitriliruptorales bacterium]|nr:BTAD domain-containing putative transcriptional regulator [Nitriliruptorales bacterium]
MSVDTPTGRETVADERSEVLRERGVRVLGPIVLAGEADTSPGGPKQRLVLAVLLSHLGRVVPTERLVTAVWGADAADSARRSLQVYVSNLRGVLDGRGTIDNRDGGYVLEMPDGAVDAVVFEELVEEGIELVESDPYRAAQLLAAADKLWRGRPYGDLADERALQDDVARLEELRLRGLEGRIAAELSLGNHEQLISELRRLTSEHPLRERLWGQLMLALYRSGRQGQALEAYEEARGLLAEELGADPSRKLQDLHGRILRQDAWLDLGPTPGGRSGEPATEPVLSVRGYDLVEKIGSGGFGVVFRGRQPSVNREVAVKVVRPEHANDPDFVRRFEIEAQTVARLEHLHIVPLYDYWREPDAAYLVMRWLRGGSLQDALRRGPWRPEAAAQVIEQVASALDLAHRQGVVHRDVKPANILLDEDDNAYLSDFGIARGPDDPPVGRSGTPYLTPEHATGEQLTAKTDVFGLGLVAYELLTGIHPYEGETPDSVRERALRTPLPAPGHGGADLRPTVTRVLARATAVDPDQRFVTAGEFAEALSAAVDDRAPAAKSSLGVEVRNPYKGLRAFHEADAADFFGREHVVSRLLDTIDSPGSGDRFVAVVGPSGAGKSSVVRAGLVPAVRAGRISGSHRWFIATMLPGEYPMAELERALIEVASCDPSDVTSALRTGDRGLLEAVERMLPDDAPELLLIVDQFEEAFAQSRVEDRTVFLRQLRTAVTDPSSRLRAVVTLRADFYDHPLLDPSFGELVAEHTVAVTGLGSSELERAITGPAQRAGIELEPQLVSEIVHDVTDEPGALPLLQYSLTELVDRSPDGRLTLDEYTAIGGVEGALAGRAEELFGELNPVEREAARQIFLRLVTVTEGSSDTRRRVLRDELVDVVGDAPTADHVIEVFGDHRLLTFDRDPYTRAPTVEIAHEALLDAWERLRGWIDGAREDLTMQRRLVTEVAEWERAGRAPAYLLSSTRLDEFQTWSLHSDVHLAGAEKEFLEASRAAERERRAEERERQEREAKLERRAVTRLRAIAVLSVVAALVAAGLSVFAFQQRDRAQQQERFANARELAAAAVAAIDEDPELGILLGLEAVRLTQDSDGVVVPEAEAALRRAVRATQFERTLPTGGGISMAPDGRLAILGVDGTVSVWDPEGWERIWAVGGQHAGFPIVYEGDLVSTEPDDVAFSADGDRLVVADVRSRGFIRDAATGDSLVELEGSIARPRYGPNGDVVVGTLLEDPDGPVEVGRVIGVWDAQSGEIVDRLEHDVAVFDYAISPDGTGLVSTTFFDVTTAWDLASGEITWSADASVEPGGSGAVAYHPDGERIALGSARGHISVVDAASGELLRLLPGHDLPVQGGAVFSHDGEKLITIGQSETRVWDFATGRRLFRLGGHADIPRDVEVTPDGTRVITSGQGGTTKIWDISTDGGVEYAAAPVAPAPAATWPGFSPDGQRLATSHPDGNVRVFDLDTMEEVLTLPTVGVTHMVRYSGDGETIVTASAKGFAELKVDEWRDEVELWDAATGERLATVDGYDVAGNDLAVNHDASMVVWVGNSGIRVVDPWTGEELYTRPLTGAANVFRATFTPGGESVFFGGFGSDRDGTGEIVDPRTGEQSMEITGAGTIRDAVFTDDGRLVIAIQRAGRDEDSVAVYDATTGERIEAIATDSIRTPTVAVHDDLLAIGHDDSLSLRKLETGEVRFSLSVPSNLIRVRFSPDGRFLLANHSHRGMHLYVVSLDDLIDLAESRVTRALTDAECQQYLHVETCP